MLGSHVDILSGFAFDSNKFNDRGVGVPIVRIRNVGKSKSDTFYDGVYSNDYILNNGDLLIGMDGDFRLAKWNGGMALLNQRVCKIKCASSELLEEYLYYMLPKQLKKIEDTTSFATVKHLSVKKIKEIKIPLPPLEQQRKIAAILDAADAYRRNTKALIAKYDELSQSLFLDMFGDPVTNPKGFLKSTVGNECNVKGGKRVPKGESLSKEITEHPYIKAQNIKNGYVSETNLEYLTNELATKLSRYIVNEGDVCITVVGVNIGDIGIVPNSLHLANLTENANKLLIKFKNKLDNTYLAHYMMSDFVQRQIGKRTMAVGVPKLALFRIQQIDLLLPPIELQYRFKNQVTSIESQKSQAQASLEKAEELFASLLQRAFKGELT